MKTLVTFCILIFFFFVINWFIQFQRDPYSYCQDHPNKKLRSIYYICWPGDFEFKKGLLEKHLETPWLNKDKEREKERERERHHQLERMDDKGLEEPELERLDPSQ